MICMKYQSLFSGKTKKNTISFLSFVQKVVKVKFYSELCTFYDHRENAGFNKKVHVLHCLLIFLDKHTLG